jgi:uncharacterized membrane protein
VAGRHLHTHGDFDDVQVPIRSRVVLLTVLGVIGLVTAVGLVRLWPDSAAVDRAGADVQFAAPGVSFPHARITKVNPTCTTPGVPDGSDQDPSGTPTDPRAPACKGVEAVVTSGATSGDPVEVQLQGPVTTAGLGSGDSIQLMRIPGIHASPDTYAFFGIDRAPSIGWLALAFVLVVILVARLRGLLALVGLGFSGFVIVKFMLPGLLTGEAGVPVTLVAASAIIYVVLYLAHGLSVRTSTALAGTLFGIGLTALLAQVSVKTTSLTGIGDETSALLSSFVGDLNFRALLTSAIIIAGLGVLNDVTITQASAVWELRSAGPELTRPELFRRAMRIGRDHIASTIYTIVFAYAGAAMSVLLLLYLYDRPILDLLGTEDIATEAVRTLCSALGLVLAVPITTGIAAATVSGPSQSPPAPTPRRWADL